MIPKEMKHNLRYGEVRRDVLRPPHDTNISSSVVKDKKRRQATCVQVRIYNFQCFLSYCFAACPSPLGFCVAYIYVLAVAVCWWLGWHALLIWL